MKSSKLIWLDLAMWLALIATVVGVIFLVGWYLGGHS